MRLIALLAQTPAQEARFTQFTDEERRFQFVPVTLDPAATLLPALARSGFAGALVFASAAQRNLFSHVDRPSVAAQDARRADVISFTNGYAFADYTVGVALTQLLEVRNYRLAGANVVIVGADSVAAAYAGALATGQPRSITVVGANMVEAEGALPRASGARLAARAAVDPAVPTHIRDADVLIRTSAVTKIPINGFGPQLLVIDVAVDGDSDIKHYAEAAGAAVYGVRELELFRVQLALKQCLNVVPTPQQLKGLLHGA